MKPAIRYAPFFLALLALACVRVTVERTGESRVVPFTPETASSPALRDSILALGRDDVAVLQQLIDRHGWPTRELVGRDGAQAAFIIAYSASDTTFQEEFLDFLKTELEREKTAAETVALLEDRLRLARGKKQLYGTQVSVKEGRLELLPIEDEKNVDKRRADLGLQPLAEYLNALKQRHNLK